MTQLGWYERQELTRSCQLMDASAWYGAYLRGYRKPNFPLPAIPLRVTIDYEFVAIWHYGKQCNFYHDDYETVFAY